MYDFPLNRVNVINMAISDEAVINRLMFETMKVEKKEFEGQRRSNENDFILHRKHLAREHVSLHLVFVLRSLSFSTSLISRRIVIFWCKSGTVLKCLILKEGK